MQIIMAHEYAIVLRRQGNLIFKRTTYNIINIIDKDQMSNGPNIIFFYAYERRFWISMFNTLLSFSKITLEPIQNQTSDTILIKHRETTSYSISK